MDAPVGLVHVQNKIENPNPALKGLTNSLVQLVEMSWQRLDAQETACPQEGTKWTHPCFLVSN